MAFALLAFIPAVLLIEAALGSSQTLNQLRPDPQARAAVGALIASASWLLVYWHALRSRALWFRRFVLGSAIVVYGLWCVGVAALQVRTSFADLVLSLALVVAAPWWYLYRRKPVAAYFNRLAQRGTAA